MEVQERQTERGPRGKYARLICRGCRSRKIKCVLPDASNITPSNSPQPFESSCVRCCSLGLTCIVERASLGRPAAKRARPTGAENGGPTTLADLDVTEETCPAMAKLEIKDYLFSQKTVEHPDSEEEAAQTPDQTLTEHEIFQAMMEPASFFALIFSKDRAFGSSIVFAGSRQTRPLLDLVGKDMAKSLDECLVWHRFFFPQVPTLIDLRRRLVAEGPMATCSTRMLFALLCLAALEMPDRPNKQELHLKQSLHLSISSHGQEFIFDPPSHRDSIIVSLLLCDYKPTALATSQPVVHKAVKSQLYINVAHHVAERLRLLPEYLRQSVQQLIILDPQTLTSYITDSLQSIQVCFYHANLLGFPTKPLYAMRRVLNRIKPQIDVLQGVLRHRQLTPRLIFQIQYSTGVYIFMRSLMDVKQNCLDPDEISIIIENVEMECSEHIQHSSDLLAATSGYSNQDEIYAAQSLLELRFFLTQIQVCGAGLLYTIIMRTRLQQGKFVPEEDPQLHSAEASTLGDQVIKTYKSIDSPQAAYDPSANFTQRFGASWPWKLRAVLQMFLGCTENLKLDGVSFHPPSRHMAFDIVSLCKNVVENNVVTLKIRGAPRDNFEELRDILRKCAQQIGAMSVAPDNSIDAAFAGGCIYAASSKLINGLCDVMECVITQFLESKKQKGQSGMFEMPMNFDFSNGMGQAFHSEEWNLLPFVGASDFPVNFQEEFDWTSALHLFESTPSSFLPDEPLDI